MVEGSGSIGRSGGVEGSGGLISPGFPGSLGSLCFSGSPHSPDFPDSPAPKFPDSPAPNSPDSPAPNSTAPDSLGSSERSGTVAKFDSVEGFGLGEVSTVNVGPTSGRSVGGSWMKVLTRAIFPQVL